MTVTLALKPYLVCFLTWYSQCMAADNRHGGPAGPHPGRRERKKAEVRQRISDAATALFLRHGFDQVSVSEIAEAADVARPTVFAHFPHKEDLFFDRYP